MGAGGRAVMTAVGIAATFPRNIEQRVRDEIVDAQIHLWGTGLPSNLSPSAGDEFTPEEAIVLMDEGGVDAAVIHPPGWDPGSTDMALAAVQNYPGSVRDHGGNHSTNQSSPRALATWREQREAGTALYVPARSGSAMAGTMARSTGSGRLRKMPASPSPHWRPIY